jgi:hypothetical protein
VNKIDVMSLYTAKGSETHELFALANRRKLSDIFSNGFSTPEILKPLLSITAIKKNNYLGIEPVFSLFDVILYVLSDCNNNDYYKTSITHSIWYLVFKDKAHTEIAGFTNQIPEYIGIHKENAGIFSISIKNSMQYAFVHKRIKRYLCSVKMLFERAVNTNKTVLKSSLTKSNASDSQLIKSIKGAFTSSDKKKSKKDSISKSDEVPPFLNNLNRDVNQQMESILNSNSSSILNLPIEYDLSFPSGDLTQLQLLYKSMQEELGAVLEIPLTKLFGTPPVGFQSTGEYDRLSYEQSLDRVANEYIVPALCEVASIMNCSEEEQKSIKYLSTYQIETLMKLINATAGNNNPQIHKMVEEYIEIKTGIKAEDIPAPTISESVLSGDVSITDTQENL